MAAHNPCSPSTRPVRASGCAAGGVLNTWITPPAALPYITDIGPRSTSRRCTFHQSSVPVWPWPSGWLKGTPSSYSRTPRTPNEARDPKPRTDSCRSCAAFWRSSATTPGTRVSQSAG